ncbi:hypothetical protein, partial [Atlantibacter hermannii]|uniref:hypothetical protein n=1 Tax=Atlantibacter hermannii TaxID=565 RepID=UPI00289FC96C
SDIRINSPPFYRLNYRGIGLEGYLSGAKVFVKPDFSLREATGHFDGILLKTPTKNGEILCRNAVPLSSLKSCFTFLTDSP